MLIDFKTSVLQRDQLSAESSVVERPSSGRFRGFLKKILSPDLPSTTRNVDLLMTLLPKDSRPTVLVVGGGTIGQGMGRLYESESLDLVAFDIYPSVNLQFIADAHHIPLPDNTFDAVVIQAVLEHVLVPQAVVGEIARVLKEGGIVYAETPFLQHVHEGPYDFTRFTESGHRYLFRNFERIASGATAGAGTQLIWSLEHVARGLTRSRSFGRAVRAGFAWLRLLDRAIPDQFNIDAASGVFFVGAKRGTELDPHEIVGYYAGAQRRS